MLIIIVIWKKQKKERDFDNKWMNEYEYMNKKSEKHKKEKIYKKV